MAKLVCDSALDAGLDYIASNCDYMHVLSQIPVSYANVATYTLGNVAMTSGDFTAGDYAGGGRQIAIDTKTVTGTANGTVTYLVLIDSGSSEILAYGDTVSQAITNGGSLSVPSWLIWMGDAA